MNSRQRRQLKRQYRYRIQTLCPDYGAYLAAWEWLESRHGVGTFNPHKPAEWYEEFELEADRADIWQFVVRWNFRNKKTAVEFALRWS